jgi:predicted  nucleic acid-binding Zn-ribbon protein
VSITTWLAIIGTVMSVVSLLVSYAYATGVWTTRQEKDIARLTDDLQKLQREVVSDVQRLQRDVDGFEDRCRNIFATKELSEERHKSIEREFSSLRSMVERVLEDMKKLAGATRDDIRDLRAEIAPALRRGQR